MNHNFESLDKAILSSLNFSFRSDLRGYVFYINDNITVGLMENKDGSYYLTDLGTTFMDLETHINRSLDDDYLSKETIHNSIVKSSGLIDKSGEFRKAFNRNLGQSVFDFCNALIKIHTSILVKYRCMHGELS